VKLEGISNVEQKFNDHIGTRTRDLPACGIAPQSSTLLHTSMYVCVYGMYVCM
jgi:hypothetical protein